MRLKATVRNGCFSACAPRTLDAAEASGLFLYLWRFWLFRSSWAGESKGALPLQGKNLHKALVLPCIPPLRHFFSPQLHIYSPSLFIYNHLVNIGYIQTKWREEIISSSCLASSWLSSFSLSSASPISPVMSTLLSSLCVPLLPSSFTKQSIHLSPPVKPH